MGKVIAVTINNKLIGGFTTIDSLVKYTKRNSSIDMLVIYCNNCDYSIKYGDINKVTVIYSPEVMMPMDRVYRQIFSLVSQVFSEGELYMFNASDRINTEFIDSYGEGNYIYGNSLDADMLFISSPIDLFTLDSPFEFIPVINISNLKNLLQSRNLYEFYNRIIEENQNMPVTNLVECNKSDMLLKKYNEGESLLNTDYINSKVLVNIINLLRR